MITGKLENFSILAKTLNRNVISKNSTSMFDISSVFPQTMDDTHRTILQSNEAALLRNFVDNRDLCARLCAHLVVNGVFTIEMVDAIMVC